MPKSMGDSPWKPEVRDRLAVLWNSGRSQSQCARILFTEFGVEVSVSSVSSQLSRLRREGRVPPADPNMQNRTKWNKPPKPKRERGPLAIRGRPDKIAKAEESKKPQRVPEDVIEPLQIDGKFITRLVDVPHGRCLWIYGDPKSDHRFCARPVSKVGNFWCPDHFRIAYPLKVAS